MKELQLNRVAKALEFPEVISAVMAIARKYELLLRDITSFEYECYAKIGRAIDEYGANIKNLGKYASRISGRVAKVHLDRSQTRIVETVPFEKVGEFIERTHVLADVEDALIEKVSLNEKIALLAQCDSRKEFVLKAWSDGIFNDLELSRMLAHSFGGTIEGHRTFLKRFKKTCQAILADIA